MGQRFQEILKNNEKYKSFDVQKIRETLSVVPHMMFLSSKKYFLGLNTNDFSEIKVPSDSFFVLGDNRDNSQDSRFIGFIPKENLVGKAQVVFISFDTEVGSFLKFWTWFPALRKDRFFVSLLPSLEE